MNSTVPYDQIRFSAVAFWYPFGFLLQDFFFREDGRFLIVKSLFLFVVQLYYIFELLPNIQLTGRLEF